jgi:hypothetical protein
MSTSDDKANSSDESSEDLPLAQRLAGLRNSRPRKEPGALKEQSDDSADDDEEDGEASEEEEVAPKKRKRSTGAFLLAALRLCDATGAKDIQHMSAQSHTVLSSEEI